MIRILKWFSLALGLLSASIALAQGNKAGQFDYYVLALSWNASWCDIAGDARRAPQCDPRHDHGFVVHGLWPQHERGWPSNCRTTQRDPSRSQTAAMADIMGSGGSAWHQWKKHGRCSGLSAEAYFALIREANERVTRPEILREIDKTLRIAPRVIEEVVLKANPETSADGVTITCKNNTFQEARICMTKDLAFRDCAPDVRRDCRHELISFPPMR